MFKNKKILVTGGAGFVGANLILRLIELGANVRATLHNKDAVVKSDNVEYIKCDLESKEDCFRVCEDIDYVFLCAANTSGAAVMDKTPLVHLTPNLIMNARMLEAAYANNVKKLLFISSNTVYPVTDYPVKEDDCQNEFFDKYFIVAWMKRFTEIACEMYSSKIKNPMKTVVVRPGNLYGPHDKFDWETSKVIAALIRRAVEKHDPFVVWGDGMDLKDFLYIDDYIDGMLLAMQKMEGVQPINIASGIPVTIRDVLGEILKSADYENVKVQYDITKPTMIPKRLIDVSLAKEKLGWSPKISLEEGISRTIKWYKNNKL